MDNITEALILEQLQVLRQEIDSLRDSVLIRLHPDDIKALAAEIVRQQQYMAEVQMDVDFMLSLSPEERKQRNRERMFAKRRATKK